MDLSAMRVGACPKNKSAQVRRFAAGLSKAQRFFFAVAVLRLEGAALVGVLRAVPFCAELPLLDLLLRLAAWLLRLPAWRSAPTRTGRYSTTCWPALKAAFTPTSFQSATWAAVTL
ncbi:hypothetical protein D3C72_2007650 [compost metagenome]